MRTAIVILSLVAAIAAEAPYQLPRPSPNAPVFNYPQAPAPAPPPPPPPQRPQPQYIPAPQPNYIPSSGYQYQQPSIAPAFVQPAPQPQIQIQPQPAYIPQAPQPLPVYNPIPYIQYAPAPQPAPLPQPAPQPIPQPQPVLLPQLSSSYGLPQPQFAPQPLPRPVQPVQPLPAYIAPQPQPQAQPAPLPNIYYQPQPQPQQGYSYSQPIQPLQYNTQLPLQSQPLSNNAATSSLSSYQADSDQYNGVQSNNEGLDSVVVDRVQNIIKENEQSSARNAGYLSLISGVSLERAKPSIEVSSFVQNSPVLSQSSSSSSVSAPSGPATDYGLPTVIANSQSKQAESSFSFLPQTKLDTTYGAPN